MCASRGSQSELLKGRAGIAHGNGPMCRGLATLYSYRGGWLATLRQRICTTQGGEGSLHAIMTT